MVNMFYFSRWPGECARWHCRKHLVKMILEYTQLMYSAHSVLNGAHEGWRDRVESEVGARAYKLNHRNHPTAKWVRFRPENYRYMSQLALECCKLYTQYYNHREHSCEKHLRWLAANPPPFENVSWCDPADEPEEAGRQAKWAREGLAPGMSRLPLAMPEECWLPDAQRAYQKYFVVHKSETMASWPCGEVPPWFEDFPEEWRPLQRKAAEEARRAKEERARKRAEKAAGGGGRKRGAAQVREAGAREEERDEEEEPAVKRQKKGAAVSSSKSKVRVKSEEEPAVRRQKKGAAVSSSKNKVRVKSEEEPTPQRTPRPVRACRVRTVETL